MCILSALYSSPYPFPATSHPAGARLPLQNLFCPPVLWFCRRKNIKYKKRNMTFLLAWDKNSCTEFSYIVSMHICITTPIGSSLPVLFIPP
jgi:hypothetical protein